MKRKKLYALILTIVCLLAFAIPSFASEPYASQQIMSYSISASSSNNYIDVEFDVTPPCAPLSSPHRTPAR